MLNYTLSDADRAYWDANHHLVLKSPFSDSQIETLRTWTHDLFELPETPGKWMKYFENSSKTGDRLLCRVENFVPYHDGLRALLTDGDVMRILSELMGEQAVLFKEKINAKLPRWLWLYCAPRCASVHYVWAALPYHHDDRGGRLDHRKWLP